MLHDLLSSALRDPKHPTELSNVAVVKSGAVFQFYTNVGVLIRRMLESALEPCFLVNLKGCICAVGEARGQLTRHPEMDAEREVVQGKEKKLSVAARLGESLSFQLSGEIHDRLAAQDIVVTDGDIDDLSAFHAFGDTTSDGLDFGKFWHGKGCVFLFEWALMTVFTKIISGDLPGHFVCRDDKAVAFLSINPIRPGHTLIVPVDEVSHWVDLDEETNAHLMKMAHRVAKAQMKVFSPERVGMIIAGFEVPHTHLHVVPIDNEGQLSFSNAAKLETNRAGWL